jgi:hypothetical protein
MTKIGRLAAWDLVLSLDTKPTEFFTSLISASVGWGLLDNESPMNFVGWGLFCAAALQLIGILLTVRGAVPIGRLARWTSSVVDGSIWCSLAALSLTVAPPTEFPIPLYAALFLNDAWIVMGIAYRGYRGRVTD